MAEMYFKGFVKESDEKEFNLLFPIYEDKISSKIYSTFHTSSGIITDFYEIKEPIALFNLNKKNGITNEKMDIGSEGIYGYLKTNHEIIYNVYSIFINELEIILKDTLNPHEKLFLASYLKNINLFKAAQVELSKGNFNNNQYSN